MPVNSLGSFVDRGPPTVADRGWFGIVGQVTDIRRAQTLQQYPISSSGHGDVSFSLTAEELELMLADMNTTTRRAIHATIPSLENFRTLDSSVMDDWMAPSSTDDENIYYNDEDHQIGRIQFSPGQVEEFMQNLSRVEIATIGTDDDLRCSICKEEYCKQRCDINTEPASGSESDSRPPGEETPEHPVELPCHHVFGEWCIRTWLLEQPASCPICRFHFKPPVW